MNATVHCNVYVVLSVGSPNAGQLLRNATMFSVVPFDVRMRRLSGRVSGRVSPVAEKFGPT